VRTSQTENLKLLADFVFESIFNTDSVVPDILLRDYARGIIECADYRGAKFEFDIKKPFLHS
jgi:hypothetical protein